MATMPCKPVVNSPMTHVCFIIDYLPVALLISPFAMGTGISVNILGTYKAQNIIR
jgi:hypothetical protein